MDNRIGQSRFWDPLWERYAFAPSVVLCRVPELEFASGLDVSGDVLDHCCGDGVFASLAWPGKAVTAGCDFNVSSIRAAATLGPYTRTDLCDAGVRLPYDGGSFDLVFDNSALEHIADLDTALKEVARVLRPDGTFVFNVLNHRYFDWWPLGEDSMMKYKKWQPFFHALNLDEWRERLGRAGFEIVSVKGYFDREASQALASLDYAFSAEYVAGLFNWSVRFHRMLPRFLKRYRFRGLADLLWETEPDSGAGYCIEAVKNRA